ncbi:MAG: flavin reductase [Clostridia bacterium]|nr:flavin reductase [Clostridia bacterium]
MSNFHSVPTAQFSPLFDRISSDWMLISASDGKRTNSMTASWGCFGILWGKQVAVCYIRPQRYTFEITERADHLSLAFFDKEHRKALAYMGSHSGRDEDKYLATGLHMTEAEDGTPFPAEARVVLLCKQLYKGRLQKSDFMDRSIIDTHYPTDDYHQMYICEIERVLIREDE